MTGLAEGLRGVAKLKVLDIDENALVLQDATKLCPAKTLAKPHLLE